MLRNITFDPPPSDPVSVYDIPEEKDFVLRLRPVTVSPAEEYALRPGEVRPISHYLASAILTRKGRAEFTLKGIVIDRADMGGRNTYYHPDSALCNDLATRERKLYYLVNPLQKDIAHIYDDNGYYLETLPIKERPAVLDIEAQARVAAGHRRHIDRAAKRLQELHAKDTAERLEELAANSREMQHAVQVLPTPNAQPVQPARSKHGEAAAAGAKHINDARASAASALAIGRAIAAGRQTSPAPSEDTLSEDWTEAATTNPRHHQPTPIESW